MDLPTIAAAPGTPPCGPPTPGDDGWVLTRYADVVAALTDPRCVVPAAPPGPEGTLAWLRGTVSRFSPPDRHAARRALGTAALDTLDPAELSLAAARLTERILDRLPGKEIVTGEPARRVPVEVLAERLGLADPAVAVAQVCAVAAAYHPGASPAAVEEADRAVAALLAMSPPAPAETTANRLGLLVQAADATAGLIGAAARHGLAAPPRLGTDTLLAEVLRLDPPVRLTRRIATDALGLGGQAVRAGERLLLRFDAANRDPAVFPEPDRFRADPTGAALTFGAGPRACPGQRHAFALAAGVVGVLRRRCRTTEPFPTDRPEVTPR
ncbi:MULTISPECIES: cytochrome P450 [unclassified Micromonospora]|uniref:cytochrome P450 n=1 Tax=unclassified Micromonospora TaxID=2617518 RepID=UPI001B37E262|nr:MULTISPECIES: cytochrome P450 [unclassified Micromonospora]MBQ1043097.1 cytochrome P450 [Micromonospora sp. C72]MBQ1056744.1 cytochrome P450 [Micromonospora sp. C32]